jgi:predicted CoA-binding protein
VISNHYELDDKDLLMVNIQGKRVRLIGLNRKVCAMSLKKTLAAKLFIKENYRIILVNAPDDYQSLLGPLPKGVNITTEVNPDADFIQVFFMNRDEMEKQLSNLKDHLKQNGWLWVSYPKGSSKITTDINRDSIWKYAKELGLKAVHQISIDETWSSMRLRFE